MPGELGGSAFKNDSVGASEIAYFLWGWRKSDRKSSGRCKKGPPHIFSGQKGPHTQIQEMPLVLRGALWPHSGSGLIMKILLKLNGNGIKVGVLEVITKFESFFFTTRPGPHSTTQVLGRAIGELSRKNLYCSSCSTHPSSTFFPPQTCL